MTSDKRFFMNGDEWGLTCIVPSENLAHCQNVINDCRKHHKDTEFSLDGWLTPPYIIPESPISIACREITLSDLESVFGGVLTRANGVDSCIDFTGKPFSCPNCFAFAFSLEDYWNCEGLYGDEDNSVVQSLHAEGFTLPQSRVDSMVSAFLKFGRRYDLILIRNAQEIVDLRELDQVRSYLKPSDYAEDS